MSESGQRVILEQTIEIYEAHLAAARAPQQVLRIILESPDELVHSRLEALLNCSFEAAREVRHNSMNSLRPGPVQMVSEELAVLREALAKFTR